MFVLFVDIIVGLSWIRLCSDFGLYVVYALFCLLCVCLCLLLTVRDF